MSLSDKIKQWAVVGRLILRKERPDDITPPINTWAGKGYLLGGIVRTEGVERGRRLAEMHERKAMERKERKRIKGRR
jgi:hypothetical protein